MIPKPSFLQSTSPAFHRQANNDNAANMLKNIAEPSFKFAPGANNSNFSPHFPRGKQNRFNQRHNNESRISDQSQNNGTVRCNFKGCKFSGPPDVVKLHTDIQHFEFRNMKGVELSNNPEDIAKWRAERRARFPTAANVEKKETEKAANLMQEAHAGGSHQHNSQHRSNYNQRNRQQQNWKSANNNRNNNNKRKHFNNHNYCNNYDKFSSKRNRSEQDMLSNNKIQEPESHGPSNEATTVANVKEESSVKESVATSVLAHNSLNLLSCYESDEESDNFELPEEQSSKAIKSDEDEAAAIRELVDDLLLQTEKSASSSQANEAKPNGAAAKSQKQQKKKQPPRQPHLTYSRLNLFQKLMLNDVRKLKPDLLQSLQMIVDSKFFQPS